MEEKLKELLELAKAKKNVLEDVEDLVFVFFALALAEVYVHIFVLNISVRKKVFCFYVEIGCAVVLFAIASKFHHFHHVDRFFSHGVFPLEN